MNREANTMTDRVSAVLESRKMKWSDLGRMVSASDQTMYGWRQRGKIPDNMVKKIADALKINKAWIRGEADDFLSHVENANCGIQPTDEFVPVPKVSFQLSAGVTGFVVDFPEDDGPPIFFRRDFFEEKNWETNKVFATKVCGDSMAPSLYDGDLVIINTKDTYPRDGKVFAINYEGELVIKRLKRDGGRWLISSDNHDKRLFPDKQLDDNAIIIGAADYKQSNTI